MTREEVVVLLRFIQAACPAQQFDELTPKAWLDVLAGVRAPDAEAAVRVLVGRQRFVGVSEIREEVRRIRDARLEHTPVPDPPPGVSDAAYPGWLRGARQAIADGRPPPAGRALGDRGLPALGAVFPALDARP